MRTYSASFLTRQGWYNAKVLSRTGDEIRVHYLNWAEKFDSNICIEDVTLIPYTARTKEHTSTKMRKPKVSKYKVVVKETASSSTETDLASKASTDSVSELSIQLGVNENCRKSGIDDIIEGQTDNSAQSSTRIRRSSRGALSPSKMKENTTATKTVSISMEETNAFSLDEDSELGTDSAEGTFSSISCRLSGEGEVENEMIDLTVRKEVVPKLLKGRECSAGKKFSFQKNSSLLGTSNNVITRIDYLLFCLNLNSRVKNCLLFFQFTQCFFILVWVFYSYIP